MRLSVFDLQQIQGGEGHVCSLSPEGAGRKLAITMSKYVYAKSTLLKGTAGCLLVYAG